MSNRPFSPTGWSWMCRCGWSTPRSDSLEIAEQRREAHIRLHTAAISIPARRPAS